MYIFIFSDMIDEKDSEKEEENVKIFLKSQTSDD